MKTSRREIRQLPSVDDAAIPAHRPGLLGRLFRLPELIWGGTPNPQSRPQQRQTEARYQPPDYEGDPD